MKVCIPVEENKGLDSKPYGHFGSTPIFVVCDLESGEVKSLDNGDLDHEHGKCQPLKALSGTAVDAVVVGGIGQGAIIKLNGMGIKVYRAEGDTISANLDLLKNGKLVEFPSDHTCSHDGCGHH